MDMTLLGAMFKSQMPRWLSMSSTCWWLPNLFFQAKLLFQTKNCLRLGQWELSFFFFYGHLQFPIFFTTVKYSEIVVLPQTQTYLQGLCTCSFLSIKSSPVSFLNLFQIYSMSCSLYLKLQPSLALPVPFSAFLPLPLTITIWHTICILLSSLFNSPGPVLWLNASTTRAEVSFCSLLFPQSMELCLAHGMDSTNIYGMKRISIAMVIFF